MREKVTEKHWQEKEEVTVLRKVLVSIDDSVMKDKVLRAALDLSSSHEI